MWSSSPGHFLLSPSSSNDPCSITNIAQYIEDYIDLVENIPNEIARHISRLHEFNNRYYQLLNELDKFWESLANGHCYLTNGHHSPSSSSTTTIVATSTVSSHNNHHHHPINGTTLYSKGSFTTSQILSKNVSKRNAESLINTITTNSSASSLSSPSSSDNNNNSNSNNSTPTASKAESNGGEKMFDQKKGLRSVYNLHKCLIEIQEISDEKLYIVQSILDLLDGKARQLDHDYRNVTIGSLANNVTSNSSKIGSSLATVLVNNDSVNHSDSSGNSNNNFEAIGKNGSNNVDGNVGEIRASTKDSSAHNNGSNVGGSGINNCGSNSLSNKRSSSRRNMTTTKSSDLANGDLTHNYKRGVKRGGVKGSGKDVKRSKSSKEVLNTSPPTLYEDTPIDPDEPTYCSCEQVSYGEMICCDNANCPIEWFHFACVSLTTKPKGKWYCPNCRGDRSNIPKK